MMLKFGLHPWIRSEENLTCVIKTATPLFVDLEDKEFEVEDIFEDKS